MNTSPSLDEALREFIDSLANEFLSAKPSGQGNATILSVDEFVSSVEERFRSTLRNRLAELATRRASELAETQDYSPQGSDHSPGEIAATIDLSNQVGEARATEKRTAGGELDATYDTLAMSADDHPTVRVRSGETPPEYQILGLLGKGGMGVVYKALHTPLNRIVAVKMILSGGHASHEQILRFKREAEAAAHLVHPNILQVYAVGEHRGMPYFSLEYVDGESMSALLRRTPLTDGHAAQLMMQVCRAVHYSHQRGVLHRDLKPQNILIAKDGTPKVADFGLAKRLEDDAVEQTHTGDVLGTPGYMAPEQARGEKSVGPHSDVYSLGAILYCVLTGRAPFVGPTPFETIRQVVAEDPVPPSRLQPKMNRDLETICLRAIEKDVSKRYRTAEELADELQRVVDGQPILARPITARERVWKWCKRNPKIAVLSSLAATLMFVLFAGGYIAAGVINTQKLAEQDARKEADANAVLAQNAEAVAKENEELAEDQADLALDATRVVLYETQQFFDNRPNLKELRQNMLDGILKEIERVYASKQDYDVKETFRASAIRQLGQIYFDAGRLEQALEKFLESEAIAKKLHVEGRMLGPEMNFSNLDLWIGDTYKKLGNLPQAKLRYESMIEFRKAYFAIMPGISRTIAEQSLAQGYGRLGDVLRQLGETKLAAEYLQMSVDARQSWYQGNPKDLEKVEEFAGSLGTLSRLYEKLGDKEKMLAASRQALKLLDRSAANKSDFPTIFNLAGGQKQLGRQLLLADDREAANQTLQDAIASYKKTLEMDADHGGAQEKAADAYYLQAVGLHRVGQDGTAACELGLALMDQLLKKSNNINNRVMKLKLLATAGRIDESTKLADEIAGELKRADYCLYAAIGYALASTRSDVASRSSELLDKAMELVRVAVVDLGFHDFDMLGTDVDFSPLHGRQDFQELIHDRAQ